MKDNFLCKISGITIALYSFYDAEPTVMITLRPCVSRDDLFKFKYAHPKYLFVQVHAS